jgi:hypothetical protein
MNIYIKFINAFFYILTFIILFYYIIHWNKIMSLSSEISTHYNYTSNEKFNDNANANASSSNNASVSSNYKLVNNKYMCQENIKSESIGYGNENETIMYMPLDEDIKDKLNPFNYNNDYSIEDKENYNKMIKNIKDLELKYGENKTNSSKLELLYKKNLEYRNFINNLSNKNRTYPNLPNVDPDNDPIKLTDKHPINRTLLSDEYKKRHYHELNNYYDYVNKNDKLFLKKYNWLNEMGKPLPLPDNFNIRTTNNDILEHRKNKSRLPQDILTDYNPLTNCKRLTSECLDMINYCHPMTITDREKYEEYLDYIKSQGYVDKYYELIGMD